MPATPATPAPDTRNARRNDHPRAPHHQREADRHANEPQHTQNRSELRKRCFEAKTLAAATVDRLLHHAHVLVCDTNESYRLAQATAGKGVTPLIARA
jgi:IstB-like ATP binding protein